MPLFSVFTAKDGGPEWRKSDWQLTDPLHHTRACPRCKADVSGGQSWRDHWAWHRAADDERAELDQAVRQLAKAVRVLALAAGHDDWYARPEEPEDEPVLGGIVIGNGPLPPETRMGE